MCNPATDDGPDLWHRATQPRSQAPLDATLHTETEQFVPGFQGGPSRHRFEDMPPDFEVDDFIANWKQTT